MQKTILTDAHRDLEFISPDLPMSAAMCGYLLQLSEAQNIEQIRYYGRWLLGEQCRQLDKYFQQTEIPCQHNWQECWECKAKRTK